MKNFQTFLVLVFISFFPRCVSGPPSYPRSPLIRQILTPEPGYKTLINRSCSEWKDEETCAVPYTIDEYDLRDKSVRETLNKLGFGCALGGKLYDICVEKPGLCRLSGGGFFSSPKEEFLSIEKDYQFLIDADAACSQFGLYDDVF